MPECVRYSQPAFLPSALKVSVYQESVRAATYLWTRQTGLAVGIQVKAVQMDVFSCWSATSVCLLLLQLCQCHCPHGIHVAFLIHISAHGQDRYSTS